MTLGDRISKILYERNLTQKDLARLTGSTEVSIGRYVNDKRDPKASTLLDIAIALGVSTDYLLGRPTDYKKTKAEILYEEFPEGISLLYKANKALSSDQKAMMLRMIEATFFKGSDK